jgi:hypothetical protein
MLCLQPTGAAQPALPPDIAWVVTEAAQFPPDQIDALRKGNVIVNASTSGDDLEAAVIAVVRIASTKQQTADYFKQVTAYEDGEVTLRHVKFSRPPIAADLSRLTLDDDERAELRSCKPGACDVRIGAAGARDVQSAIDWRAPDAAARADAWVRQRVLAYVSDYLARGDAALITYGDKAKPVSLQQEWRGMLSNSPALTAYAPALQRHLTDFPSAGLPGAQDELYWDRQHLSGLKTILGVTHMVTWADAARPDRIFIAQKQIYASHYFYGSLAVTMVLQDPADANPPASYIVYVNRARGDLLKGGFGGLRKRLAEQTVTSAAKDMLTQMKQALER